MKNEKLICGCILAGIFLLSFYIRGILPYLSSSISISGNDPWYNLRLVESILHNFPHRIYFDAFTHLPYGTEVPFAPLFDYLIAVVIWIIGLGNPYATLGEEGIKTIFVWFPPVLGALCIFPVFLIGKTLWNRNAGLIAAVLIAVLPGQFLSRSLLGFTDHHVLEVLLSTAGILMFILAIKTAKDHNLQLKTIKERDWMTLKKPLFFSILSGIVFGAFYLSWRGAPIFMFILLIYALVQFVVDHLRDQNTEYLCFAVIPAFLVSLIIVSPFLLVPYAGFSKFQVISLVIGIIVFISLSILSAIFKYKNFNTIAFPFVILSIGTISLIILNIFVPSLYHLLIGNLNVFFPHGGALTIQEVNPMQISHIWGWFSTTFFVAFLGLWFTMHSIRNHKRPEEVLFLIWCLVMLFACFGQNRFAYYYAVNVALLCGLALWKLIELVVYKKETKKVKGKSRKSKTKQTKKTLNKSHAIIVCSLIFLIVVLPPMSTSLKVAKYPGSIPNDWYDALTWMRNNTPDPGVDYYGIYEAPPKGENYNYPDSAYSVMSWWDYGHWITTIAHRIPFANPFQAGAQVAANYLIETNETEANKILDRLDVKYVILDYPICDFLPTPTFPNPKYVMPIWTGKNPNPLQTVMVRLHYFDGSEVISENIPALQHYKLIYESSTFVLPFSVIDPKTNRIIGWRAYHGPYEPIKNDLHKLHEGAMIGGESNIAKTPEFFHPFGYVKIFEYVPQPNIIEGDAPNGSSVTASIKLVTNQNREFNYEQTTLSDGKYRFLVPYSGNYTITTVKEGEETIYSYLII